MGYKEVSCRMKVPVPASSPLSSSFSHGSGSGKGPGSFGKGPGSAGKGPGSAGKGPGSGGGVLENESSPKKIVLTKLSRRTKLLAYGTCTSKRY